MHAKTKVLFINQNLFIWFFTIIMKRKLRKSLWGLQWIFLKNEQNSFKQKKRRATEIIGNEDSVASDIEDFPEISMRKLEDYDVPAIKINKASTKEKYKMSHIEDLPNLGYKNPHIHLDLESDNTLLLEKQRFERKLESSRQSRPMTVGIRQVVYPDKHIIRHKKLEPNTSTNRRKNYGKWFIPPEKWRQSLDSFIEKRLSV